MKAPTLMRAAVLAACLTLSSCLINSAIVSGNVVTYYVPKAEAGGTEPALVSYLRIAGTTATLSNGREFVVDDPVFEKPSSEPEAGARESRSYRDDEGDVLEFKRRYSSGTDQWLEQVTLTLESGESCKLIPLPGYSGDERSTAWGIYY